MYQQYHQNNLNSRIKWKTKQYHTVGIVLKTKQYHTVGIVTKTKQYHTVGIVTKTKQYHTVGIVLKTKQYHTVGIVLKTKQYHTVVERGQIDTPNTPMHDHSMSWLGTETSIKMAGF